MKSIKELLELHDVPKKNMVAIDIGFKRFGLDNSYEVQFTYYDGDKHHYFTSLTALKQFVEAKLSTQTDTMEEAETALETELGGDPRPIDEVAKEVFNK